MRTTLGQAMTPPLTVTSEYNKQYIFIIVGLIASNGFDTKFKNSGWLIQKSAIRQQLQITD